MNNELKPCPFCGSKPNDIILFHITHAEARIECPKCNCRTDIYTFNELSSFAKVIEAINKSIEAWNRRTTDE
jgi:Lar family restriction alleviation protein